MNHLKFEDRNRGSNPIIKRIEYNGYYIYFIEFLIGCNCNYVGCESYNKSKYSLKVRKVAENYRDCELVLTKENKNKVKLNGEINEIEAIEIFKKEY